MNRFFEVVVEERVDTVTQVVEAVMTEPDEKPNENNAVAPKVVGEGVNGNDWEPF